MGKVEGDRMYENNVMKKMIAVTNRHLVLENDTDGAYLKQLTYVASLHPKAMVLREKDLTEEKYEELAKVVIKLCEKAGTTLILHRFPEVVHHLGYDKLHLPLEMLKNYRTAGRTYTSWYFDPFCRRCERSRTFRCRLCICRKYL